jgi:calpain-5
MGKSKIHPSTPSGEPPANPPFPDQSYSSLRKTLLSSGEKFCDPHFPCDATVLAATDNVSAQRHDAVSGVRWLRASEIADRPVLISGGASASDVRQGSLGSCWLLAAIGTALGHPRLVRHLAPDSDGERSWDKGGPEWVRTGLLRFRVWRFGEEVEVVIDDRLPCGPDGVPIYAHSTEPHELLVPLLEKMYAKLCGGYWALDGGDAAEALVDFTGGISESVALQDKDASEENLFKRLDKLSRAGAMMSASISTDPTQMEAVLQNGLVMGHAYSVTGVFKLKLEGSTFFKNKTQTVIRLRNPWGSQEFNGAWSDGSPEWQSIHSKERAKLGLVAEDDGEFFMAFDDFLNHFTRLVIVNSVNTSLFSLRATWHSHFFHSWWARADPTVKPPKRGGTKAAVNTAGGCINNRDTFTNNPQFLVDLPEAQDLILAVHQRDRRGDREHKHHTIGFSVVRTETNRPEFRSARLSDSTLAHPVVGKVTFINSREVATTIHDLPRGKYIIVPSTFDANEETDFLLRAYTETRSASVKQLVRSDPKRRFWQSSISGSVRVVVRRIEGGKSRGLIDKGDMYVRVRCGPLTKPAKTRVISQNAVDPVWDEPLLFWLKGKPAKRKDRVEFALYDEDFGFDDFAGEAILNVADLAKPDKAGEWFEMRLVLKDRGGKTIDGKLVVAIQYAEGTQ